MPYKRTHLDQRITVRFSATERDLLKTVADHNGVAISTLLRVAALAYAKRVTRRGY